MTANLIAQAVHRWVGLAGESGQAWHVPTVAVQARLEIRRLRDFTRYRFFGAGHGAKLLTLTAPEMTVLIGACGP